MIYRVNLSKIDGSFLQTDAGLLVPGVAVASDLDLPMKNHIDTPADADSYGPLVILVSWLKYGRSNP